MSCRSLRLPLSQRQPAMYPAANRTLASLNSRSPSRRNNRRFAATSNNATDTMPASQYQPSPTMSQSAVSETVRRVNATALVLLTRRAEINRRIRCLHQVVQGLKDLGSRDLATFTASHANNEPSAAEPKASANSPREYTAGVRRSPLPDRSKHLVAGLSRACRIALMEAGGAASLEEIRSRIVRRGSFLFTDSAFANAAIFRTLHAMSNAGEIRHLEDGPQSRWQRINPTGEINT
jgi:hypothetical protein